MTAPRPPMRHPGLNLGHHHGDAHEKAETIVFGFWVFLMSDLIIFGLMFATYSSMVANTAGGPGPKDLFDLGSAFAQTCILLTSSLTMGFASLALKYKHSLKWLKAWLVVTACLGASFLTLEINDFHSMISAGAVPQRSGFLSAFFGLVPLHGLHVLSGLIWLAILLVQIEVFGASDDIKIRILRLGLFWHFLDIIWIAIFTIVYIGGLA